MDIKSFKYITIVWTLIFACSSAVAQTYSTSASWKATVASDSVYMFADWNNAVVCASSPVESTFEWFAFDDATLAFDKLLKSSQGLFDSFIPTEKCGVLCRVKNADSQSETRFWVDVPVIESVALSVDSIYCDGMDVTGSAQAKPTSVYDIAKSQWTDVPQQIIYNWYVSDTLQLTTGQIQPVLESPMQHGALKVVAQNQVFNSAEAVDTVDAFGVKALYTFKAREREVLNEIASGDAYSAPAEIEFTNNSKGNVTVNEWVMGTVSRLYDKNPVYSFQTTGNYRVSLIVTDEDSGCSSVDSTLQISVTDAFLRFPDVFTPNGDGVNDEFRPAYKSLKSYEITIYNRWGRKIYHSTDPSTGWNGNEGGAKAAEGVYLYSAEGIGFDKGVKIKRHGSVTLIR